jgi:hypothetical protein
VDESSPSVSRQIELLEAEVKRLEAEYNMFFAGRLPRPPWETRSRVEALMKQMDRQHLTNYAERFRFNTLQTRFAKFIDLWDRGLRAREEGRRGPFAQPKAAAAAPPRQAGDGVVYATTIADPLNDMEKVQEMYERLTQARQQSQQDATPVPFHKFVDMVRKQLDTLKQKGGEEVAFRVALKDGKVVFTARAMRGAPKSEE